MKKSATKTAAPMNLGTKRNCPKCALKFYDFGKPQIQCPKCGTEVDPDAQLALFRQPPEGKKSPKKIIRDDDEEVTTTKGEEAFESVDDLNDDDEEALDDLADKEEDE